MCFSSLFLCKIMASHFHIFRTEDIKLEKKYDHGSIFQCLDVGYFFTVQWSRSLRYEKLILNNIELINSISILTIYSIYTHMVIMDTAYYKYKNERKLKIWMLYSYKLAGDIKWVYIRNPLS